VQVRETAVCVTFGLNERLGAASVRVKRFGCASGSVARPEPGDDEKVAGGWAAPAQWVGQVVSAICQRAGFQLGAPGERSREIWRLGSAAGQVSFRQARVKFNRDPCRRRLREGPTLTFELSRRHTQIAGTGYSGVCDVRLERKVRRASSKPQ